VEIADFELERYFARWEFDVAHLLCASDPEPVAMRELLALADDEVMALWDGLHLGYTEAPGHPLLRAEIAGRYEHVTPDQVLVCSGAQEAIFLTLGAMLGPGDHAVVVWPAYQSLHEVARASGAEVTLIELAHDEGWALDPARVRAALRPTTRVVVVNAPHNPTGALFGRDVQDELVALAEEAGVWLLSDEVYRLLEFDQAGRLPQAADRSERAVSLNVMTKAFGLGGLRIGWVATRDERLLGRIAAHKDYTTICNSAPSELLALAGLRASDTLLARARAIIDRNLALLDEFIATADWIDWVRPQAGTIGFPRLRADVPAERLAEELIAAEGVLLLPGSAFGHQGNHIRIGFGRRDLPQALARLSHFADTRVGRFGRFGTP
jgi:aspartate/methionine/tyrosine aminotransferase